MIALLLKELEELSGIVALAVFAVVVVAWAHTTIPLALYPGDAVIDYLIEDITAIGCLAAFAAGHSRFGPEYQQGTIAFLDALPITRTRVFAVKLAAGLVPVAIFAGGTGAVKAWALGAHPLPDAVPPAAVGALITLACAALLLAHYATGLVLSWFGDVGWQAMLVGALCLILATAALPWVGPYYPIADGVVHVTYAGGWPRIAVGPVAVWSTWAAAATSLAWYLFRGAGDRIVYGPAWVRGLAQVLVYAPPVAALLALVGLSAFASAVSLPGLVQPTFRAATEHFRFVANQADREAAEALVARAEEVRARVAERFGVPGPTRLDVELTGASEHLGGVFIPGKLQLRSDATAAVLAHELSHAFAHELGAPADPEAWRFFEEGLATLTESVVGAPDAQAAVPAFGTPASDWLLAPAHSSRSRVYNPDEDYAIGRVWAEALVAVGGLEAPPCVIRAAGEAPRDGADPVPWWSGLLATCGLDLADVVAAYEEGLPQRAPTPMVGWLEHADWNVYRVRTTEPPEGTSIVCMARPDASAGRTTYVYGFPEAGEPCELSRWNLGLHGFELVVGYGDRAGHHLGEWRTIGVP